MCHGKNELDNRELINQKQNEKLLCECGIQYPRCNRSRHVKTTHHKEYMEDQDDD